MFVRPASPNSPKSVQRVEQSGSDRDLIARMARGDEQALAALYDRFGNLAYSLAFQILGNGADAEEIESDAFVQAWSSAATFDPARASAGAWLTMITRTRALDRLRSSKRRSQLLEEAAQSTPEMEGSALPIASVGPEPDQQAEQSDLRTRVNEALTTLPDNQRKVLELAFFGRIVPQRDRGCVERAAGNGKNPGAGRFDQTARQSYGV